MNLSKKEWKNIFILVLGVIVGVFLVIIYNSLTKFANSDNLLDFLGNIVGVLLAGFISFLVAQMQLNVAEKRRQKEELSNLNAAMVRFQEEEETISSHVGEPSQKLASINFNEFMKRRGTLIENKAKCTSILGEKEKNALEAIFTESHQQANNYVQAFVIKNDSDTKGEAISNIGQGKWKNNIDKNCKIITTFINGFNKA